MDERALARCARTQHGVVALDQLTALGLDRRSVDARVRAGRFHRLHRGVYAVGPARLSRAGIWMAAVLTSGPGAVLSHRDAAALRALRPSNGRRIDVSTPHRSRRGAAGIRLHRPRHLPPDEVEIVDRIPTTTVARTLVDLAAVLPPADLRRAVHEAEVARVLDLAAVDRVLARSRGRRGVVRLAALVAAPPEPGTRSELERRFWELVHASELPDPRMDACVEIAGELREVDALWRQQRLVVELDSRSVHGTTAAFEGDRAKDIDLVLRGYRVVRVTWTRLTTQPGRVLADLRALLKDSGTASPARG